MELVLELMTSSKASYHGELNNKTASGWTAFMVCVNKQVGCKKTGNLSISKNSYFDQFMLYNIRANQINFTDRMAIIINYK